MTDEAKSDRTQNEDEPRLVPDTIDDLEAGEQGEDDVRGGAETRAPSWPW